ncbi:MAG: hypothetical protein L3V56_04820 [Candidatus Magnetoovum sp. WYHC-5]|nr:hypothetical protein [Candidatus Magnetoovum sp. WYHC-5]
MNLLIDKNELKDLIGEVVRQELLKFAINFVPYVSDEEMKDIAKCCSGEDFTEDNFINITEWLGR